MDKIRPFIKWAGGKTQIMNEIQKLAPKNIKKYYEPFVGGGALLFKLKFKEARINDLNKNLIHLYETIQKNPHQLIKFLKVIDNNKNSNKKEYFLEKRKEFNKLIKDNKKTVKSAAIFIYLNKTSFNGLYRVNSEGMYNVPFNYKKNRNSFDEANILNISTYLKKIKIQSTDFEQACKYARAGDFVFFDPPYVSLKKSTFVSYTKEGFNCKDHVRLAKFFKKLSDRNINCMLTNHNTPFVHELYKDFNIKEINVRRMINSNASNRVGKEVIITNFKEVENV